MSTPLSDKIFNIRMDDETRQKLLSALDNPFQVVEGERFFCRFETDFKAKVPLRSKLPRPEKKAGLRFVVVSNDMIDEYNRGTMPELVNLLLSVLPPDVCIADNPSSNAIMFLVPDVDALGRGMWYDSTGIVFGSQQWIGPESGKAISRLNLEFRKDPITWAMTCNIVEDNDK